MLQEQPKEKEAPQVLGSLPWHAQVRLQGGDTAEQRQPPVPRGDGSSGNGTEPRIPFLHPIPTSRSRIPFPHPVPASRSQPGLWWWWDLLVVEAAAAAGGVAVLGEGVGEFLVQRVAQRARDALPGQDEDDDDGVLAVVAGPVPHQAQQLLLLVVSADHLENRGAKSERSNKHLPAWGGSQEWVLDAFPSALRRGRAGGVPMAAFTAAFTPWALGGWAELLALDTPFPRCQGGKPQGASLEVDTAPSSSLPATN